MTMELWRADCGDVCGFGVWGHDQKEVAQHLADHSRHSHGSMTDLKAALKMVKHAYDAKAKKG